jgi:predicted NUDIX family NTP pyrophosphohydrolase
MNVLDQARLIIYRVNKKGLEIFLINPDGEKWELPKTQLESDDPETQIILLDPIKGEDGHLENALAVEGDWHDIPSIRSVIKDDVHLIKDQLIQMMPEMEKGAYFAVKEAFKKLLPEQYAFLKELKDILLDRNQVNSI